MAKKNLFEQVFEKDIPLKVIDFNDFDGNRITVVIQDGANENRFGNNDTSLKVVNGLVDSMDFKFEFEDDPYSFEKRIISIIDTIGKKIKHNSSYKMDKPNIHIVKEFIEFFSSSNLHKHSEFKNILDQVEEIDEEEEAFWKSLMDKKKEIE
ncbi:hypothetical protein OB236_23960 [Paenibacillus sp. WQ 127069]|uniref:DUF4375 domain-containing protein n=1 Tax=Paenibacillus baimaensis TaxID=2982185 RepID=A0ABT2UKK0_9BACL|nr:hypothetical protein [Paenibacillus sp. WQ 127069]MCU6795167.1 hypothetical protein [Paenibacillus sp. WQ 127069]